MKIEESKAANADEMPGQMKSGKHYAIEIVRTSFSAQNIIQKLMKSYKYQKDDQELENFNAIRVMSICIIVLGNTYL